MPLRVQGAYFDMIYDDSGADGCRCTFATVRTAELRLTTARQHPILVHFPHGYTASTDVDEI